MEDILAALATLRAPIQQGEYDLHQLVIDTLRGADIPYRHEVPLALGCRIDLMCGTVGIEIKRGKPNRTTLLRQLTRYASAPELTALIVVMERSVDLPRMLCGKPVRLVCLNRLWGIAL